MQIVSDVVKIANTGEFITTQIESELISKGFKDVVRWAIVDIENDFFTVCVSHVII